MKCQTSIIVRLRGGSKRQGGKLIGNSHLPHFMPSKFDLNMKTRPSDKSTDFVAGDGRVETHVNYVLWFFEIISFSSFSPL